MPTPEYRHDVSLPGFLQRPAFSGGSLDEEAELDREVRNAADRLERLQAEKKRIEVLHERETAVLNRRDDLTAAIAGRILEFEQRIRLIEGLGGELERGIVSSQEQGAELQQLTPNRLKRFGDEVWEQAEERLEEIQSDAQDRRDAIEERFADLTGEAIPEERGSLSSAVKRGFVFFLPTISVGTLVLVVCLLIISRSGM